MFRTKCFEQLKARLYRDGDEFEGRKITISERGMFEMPLLWSSQEKLQPLIDVMNDPKDITFDNLYIELFREYYFLDENFQKKSNK